MTQVRLLQTSTRPPTRTRASRKESNVNLELHILQNFAPSNLNRDDTGSPKSCDFGGYRRARISSQAIKRAIRREFKEHDLIPPESRAVRTKRVREELVARLAAEGRPADDAGAVAESTLSALGIDLDSSGEKTEYLLYLGEAEVAALTAFCDTNWDELSKLTAGATRAGRQESGPRRCRQSTGESGRRWPQEQPQRRSRR